MSDAGQDFRTVGQSAELPNEWVNPYYLDDLRHRVSVARVGDRLFAFDDLYGDMPLSAGLLDGNVIMSQGDGSMFDLTDGHVVRGPANEPLRTYPVREVGGHIQVRI
ncbi:Rieske (2Fe-2S) protein [Janibacter cremeus]|uniref:Nitrite reductase/ring-hydroxylating ferredoxin subunit n=1 Tax=Janibacter cremeus TaxID=1285192 RepID=A0A852VPT9_9MICO|nr:nitrite reductase (NAD(P)H) small subunit [Janibacter cremeus]NYF97480.1 nitrite reductase/ring-hydroxylating ferredoxin subunit [Janibacter cremeus]